MALFTHIETFSICVLLLTKFYFHLNLRTGENYGQQQKLLRASPCVGRLEERGGEEDEAFV